ncbi:MAG: ABC transporter permease subunit, partial [Chloroflexota bacterium]|nr:ABC transporter permease subunit [Chloroflexota bacterium]
TLTQMGILVAVLIGMGTIAQERNRGTLSMTLSKPVRWGTFITAKLAAMSVVFLVSLGIASLGCYGYSAYLFEGANGVDFLLLNLLLGLYFVTCLAEVILCSSLFRNQLAAGGLALAILITQAALTAIPSLSHYLPNGLVNWGIDIVSGASSSAWAAVGVSIGIICVSLIASLRILELKEL